MNIYKSLKTSCVLAAFALIHCWYAPSAVGQGEFESKILYSVFADAPTHQLGKGINSIPDIDGDGIADFMAGTGQRGKYLRVFSGLTGRVLYTLNNLFLDDNGGTGNRITGISDANDDGSGDYLVVIQRINNGSVRNVVLTLRSGKDGSVIRTHLERSIHNGGVDIPGDTDGDGVEDYEFFLRGGGWGTSLYSGSDGTVLSSFAVNSTTEARALSGVGDIDGDGFRNSTIVQFPHLEEIGYQTAEIITLRNPLNGTFDLASLDEGQVIWRTTVTDSAGEYVWIDDISGDGVWDFSYMKEVGATQHWVLYSRVVLSGANGQQLWRSPPRRHREQPIAPIGDIDDDGFLDVVIGANNDNLSRDPVSKVQLLSGRDGSLLAEASSNVDGDAFGWFLTPIGDINGDGVAEVAVAAPGTPETPGALQYVSRIDVISFRRVTEPPADELARLRLVFQGGQLVLTWNAGLLERTLERSTDLINWETVNDAVLDGFYTLPTNGQAQSYYRIRFRR